MSYFEKGPGPTKCKLTHSKVQVERKLPPVYAQGFHHWDEARAKPLSDCFYHF